MGSKRGRWRFFLRPASPASRIGPDVGPALFVFCGVWNSDVASARGTAATMRELIVATIAGLGLSACVSTQELPLAPNVVQLERVHQAGCSLAKRPVRRCAARRNSRYRTAIVISGFRMLKCHTAHNSRGLFVGNGLGVRHRLWQRRVRHGLLKRLLDADLQADSRCRRYRRHVPCWRPGSEERIRRIGSPQEILAVVGAGRAPCNWGTGGGLPLAHNFSRPRSKTAQVFGRF